MKIIYINGIYCTNKFLEEYGQANYVAHFQSLNNFIEMMHKVQKHLILLQKPQFYNIKKLVQNVQVILCVYK